jgi:hypothetical protein
LLAWASFGQSTCNAQTFALSDTKELVLVNVKAEAVEYKGRNAVRLTKDTEKEGFALLRGTDFQDGTIEGDIALKITAPPGVRMPGFVGIAFRARWDASRYELFYLRPGNSRSDDQEMRNHSVQYVSPPDFDWYRLRQAWPWVYEAYADLQTETWTSVRIEVKGRSAKLYLNGSEQPSLVVDGLKGEDLRGGVALWGYQGEEAYFSNVRITNSTALPVKNGSDEGGTWQVRFSSYAGNFDGTLQVTRDGSKVSGAWSGALGNTRPVSGTWRDGYVEFGFNAQWPSQGPGDAGTGAARLAGWVDGDSAAGRMRVENLADGRWTATREPLVALLAVDDPFVGNWKLNPSKSRFPDEMKVKAAGANRYLFDFGAGNTETIVADGTDQPGIFGTTLSVTVEGPDTWKVVRKKDGRTLVMGIWKLSKDGRTLSDTYRENQPDGSTFSMDYVYKRTTAGSGFAATWESVSERMNSVYELQIQRYGGDGLTFIAPAERETRNLRFDGKDYPDAGPNVAPGSVSSGRRVNERTLEVTDKIKGKVKDVRQIELSADGKTLTMTVHLMGQGKPNLLVFDRE